MRPHGIGVGFFVWSPTATNAPFDTGSGVRIGNDAETLRRTETSPWCPARVNLRAIPSRAVGCLINSGDGHRSPPRVLSDRKHKQRLSAEVKAEASSKKTLLG